MLYVHNVCISVPTLMYSTLLQTTSEFREEYGLQVSGDLQSVYAQYAYDAVWTIALAFNSTLSRVPLNVTQQSGFRELLRAELSGVNFLGISVSYNNMS